jgi:hypothetical protein
MVRLYILIRDPYPGPLPARERGIGLRAAAFANGGGVWDGHDQWGLRAASVGRTSWIMTALLLLAGELSCSTSLSGMTGSSWARSASARAGGQPCTSEELEALQDAADLLAYRLTEPRLLRRPRVNGRSNGYADLPLRIARALLRSALEKRWGTHDMPRVGPVPCTAFPCTSIGTMH